MQLLIGVDEISQSMVQIQIIRIKHSNFTHEQGLG